MDQKDDLKKVLDEMGDVMPAKEQLNKMKDIAEEYSDKSEDDIFFEIIKLNKKMENEMEPDEYNELMSKLERIRPLLDEEQVKRLDKILQALREE